MLDKICDIIMFLLESLFGAYGKVSNNTVELTEEEKKERAYKKELLDRIEEANLYCRAERLVKIANYCIEKKIQFPDSRRYGYKYGFTCADVKTDNVHVHFNMYDCNYDYHCYCSCVVLGKLDIYRTFRKYDTTVILSNTGLTTPLSRTLEIHSWELELLLNEFDDFERAFLDWCKKGRIQYDGELTPQELNEYRQYKKERLENNG